MDSPPFGFNYTIQEIVYHFIDSLQTPTLDSSYLRWVSVLLSLLLYLLNHHKSPLGINKFPPSSKNIQNSYLFFSSRYFILYFFNELLFFLISIHSLYIL